MIFNVDGQVWVAHFEYVRPEKICPTCRRPHNKKKVRDRTNCIIHAEMCLKTEPKCQRVPELRGTGICNPRDQFSFAGGRRAAFADAIKMLPYSTKQKFWAAFRDVTEAWPVQSSKKNTDAVENLIAYLKEMRIRYPHTIGAGTSSAAYEVLTAALTKAQDGDLDEIEPTLFGASDKLFKPVDKIALKEKLVAIKAKE
jgi:hypothetical protein